MGNDLNSPQERIVALELYATLLLMNHITSHSIDMNLRLPTVTDNLANASALTNYHCKKWPNSAILMEMALAQHHLRGLS